MEVALLAQCQVFLQRRQVSGVTLVFHAVSMSIRTELPGDGLEWVKCRAGGVGMGWNITRGRVHGGSWDVGLLLVRDMKCLICYAILIHPDCEAEPPSGSVSGGLLNAIIATAVKIWRSRPQWNLTTTVFRSVYPES